MENTSFPFEGEKCEDPIGCTRRAERWEQLQQFHLEKAECEVQVMQNGLKEGENILSFSDHLLSRQFDRSISKNQVIQTLRNGWPIERRENDIEITLTIIYHHRLGSGGYRPLHVVCTFNKKDPKKWTVKTAYDPRSDKRKWDNGYQKRICFCK